ncbi:MAG TPA: DUF3617 domain-containing protein [Anaeromyxobacter sp.]|nr:DUF3617 domain-containing protein [Anaeromyxobacter sp.]
MSIRNVLRLGLCLFAAAVLSTSARAADTEPGVWWEHTIQAEMGGMSMPATTSKSCVPKAGIREPPGAADDRCKVTDVKKSGNKMTWKMVCEGPDAMTGTGEIVHTKNSFDGKMSMHMPQGDMTMKMKGKLVGGDCDASATKKQVAAFQKQQAAQQEQVDQTYAAICQQGVDGMLFRLFAPPLTMCKDPAAAARACSRLNTRDGFLVYANAAASDPELPGMAKKVCKKDPDGARAKLCAQTAKEARGLETPEDVLEFLGEFCPDEARALAKQECAGRKFTGIPPGFRKVCVEYARQDLGGGNGKVQDASSSESAPQEDPARKAVKDKAKGVLRGLFK